MNCSHGRLRGIDKWTCRRLGSEETWELQAGEVTPIWCPVYKAQVREVPLIVVTERWEQYHFVERAVMRATTWDVRVRMIACTGTCPEERLRGLRGVEVWYADGWYDNILVRHNNPVLMDIQRRW